MQSQNALTAYLKSKQLLPFGLHDIKQLHTGSIFFCFFSQQKKWDTLTASSTFVKTMKAVELTIVLLQAYNISYITK